VYEKVRKKIGRDFIDFIEHLGTNKNEGTLKPADQKRVGRRAQFHRSFAGV